MADECNEDLVIPVKLELDRRGQAAVVWTTISTVIALVIGIIVIHQFFVSGAGPTDKPYLDDNGNPSDNAYNWENVDNHDQGLTAAPANPQYDADALDSYNRVKTLAWVAIGILALVILALAAVTIMSVFRGGLGGKV